MEFTNEELQEYLDKHVKRAVKEMKQKAYGRQHRKLLYDIDEIEFKFEKESDCLGKYIIEGIAEYENTTILISDTFVKNKKSLFRYDDEMIKVIKHELVHHYVSLWYDNKKGDTYRCDSSPIFLSYLVWFNSTSNHICFENFIKTDLYKEVINIKEFDELRIKMRELYYGYRDVFKKLETDIVKEELFSNSFMFGTGKTIGMEKDKMTIFDDIYNIKDRVKSRINFFDVGSTVLPQDIERLYLRKKYSKCHNTEFPHENKDTIKIVQDELIKNNKDKELRILNYKIKKSNMKKKINNLSHSVSFESEEDILTLRDYGLLIDIKVDRNFSNKDKYRFLIKTKSNDRKSIYTEMIVVNKSDFDLRKLEESIKVTDASDECVLDLILDTILSEQWFEYYDLELLRNSGMFKYVVKNECYESDTDDWEYFFGFKDSFDMVEAYTCEK